LWAVTLTPHIDLDPGGPVSKLGCVVEVTARHHHLCRQALHLARATKQVEDGGGGAGLKQHAAATAGTGRLRHLHRAGG